MPTLVTACEAMATRFEWVIHGDSPSQLRAAADEAFNEVRRLEEHWSLFRPSSDLSLINAHASQRPVQVEPGLFDLLSAAHDLWQETQGAFDISVGALMRYWGFRQAAATPTAPLHDTAACPVGMQHVHLDPQRRTVHFDLPGLQLDLGAIGKGAALDAAAAILNDAGITCALLHAGTSTIRAIGCPEGLAGWPVALPTPDTGRAGTRAADLAESPGSTDVLRRVLLCNESLSVSAPWGRETRTAIGAVRGHIMDPRTGTPVQHILMAAIIASKATDADALSTALLVGGETLDEKLALSRPGIRTLRVTASDGPVPWLVHATGDWGQP